MPQLKTHRAELYAEARAQGLTRTAAAKRAGYLPTAAHVRGSQLDKDPQVRARIDELRLKMDDRLADAVTADRVSILRGIGELAAEARAANDRPTALRAMELLGKSIGMFTDRHTAVASPLEGLTAEQLMAIIRLAEQAESGTINLQAVPTPGLQLRLAEPDDGGSRSDTRSVTS